MADTYQTIVRRELRKIPTSKLQEAYGKLKAGEPTGIELVERDRAYAISAIEEVLWERGKLPTSSSHSSGGSMAIKEEELEILKGLLVPVAICTGVVVIIGVLGRVFTARRTHYQGGQYLVSVRYPGQWHDIREFVQPANPDVLSVYSEIGPDSWVLYDFVCRNIDYRRDVGEFWQTPSETLRGAGDCEDSANLLTSLLLATGMPAYTVLGNYQGYGHAWCEYNGQVMETTYTSARPVPDPQDYCPYVLFDNTRVLELWPGALGEVFELGRNEELKLSLISRVLELA